MKQTMIRCFHEIGCAAGMGLTALLFAGLCIPVLAQETEVNDVVIHLQKGYSIEKFARDHHSIVDDHVPGTEIYTLLLPDGETQASFQRQIHRDRRALSVEANLEISVEQRANPIHFAFDAGPNPGSYLNQYAYHQVNLGQAQQLTKAVSVVVAVLDTGATPNHPALRGHYLTGYNTFDPTQFPLDLPDGEDNLAVGHGTMIAGLIARLAPTAMILPVRVLNGDGIGTMMTVVHGIYYAMANQARIINISFGSPRNSQVLEEALDAAHKAGILVVASAGNDGSETRHYPAALGDVIAVAALEDSNVKSSYSNFGEFIGLDAPGTGIRSTYWTGGYATWSGTSFAAPFVTATAALALMANPDLTADRLSAALKETARPIDRKNPAYREKLGHGLIDIERAVRFASTAKANTSGGDKISVDD